MLQERNIYYIHIYYNAIMSYLSKTISKIDQHEMPIASTVLTVILSTLSHTNENR